MKISILGSGRWASNLAGLCLKNGHEVLTYEKILTGIPESEFFSTGKNSYIDLSKYYLDGRLKCTHDLERAIDNSDYIIISILSQKLNEFMQDVKNVVGYSTKKYCIAMKGVEATTGRTLTEIMMDNGVYKNNLVALAGPGHVQSISAGHKTHMVVAGYNADLAEKFKQILSNDGFKLFPNPDVKGVEICAAAKNVYGALAGICVGSENDTLRGSLMCASLAEMEHYLDSMQCVPKTARRLPLLGDYDATMYDKNSHNLNYGIEVMRQNTIEPKLSFSSIEGKEAVAGLLKRMINYNNQVSDSMQLRAPLLTAYNNVVKGIVPPSAAIEEIESAIDDIYSHDEL
ncbi:MAG: hypothetical protein ACLRFL_03485 [Clostridia bacterium]